VLLYPVLCPIHTKQHHTAHKGTSVHFLIEMYCPENNNIDNTQPSSLLPHRENYLLLGYIIANRNDLSLLSKNTTTERYTSVHTLFRYYMTTHNTNMISILPNNRYSGRKYQLLAYILAAVDVYGPPITDKRKSKKVRNGRRCTTVDEGGSFIRHTKYLFLFNSVTDNSKDKILHTVVREKHCAKMN
jgi:hypothetical protein